MQQDLLKILCLCESSDLWILVFFGNICICQWDALTNQMCNQVAPIMQCVSVVCVCALTHTITTSVCWTNLNHTHNHTHTYSKSIIKTLSKTKTTQHTNLAWVYTAIANTCKVITQNHAKQYQHMTKPLLNPCTEHRSSKKVMFWKEFACLLQGVILMLQHGWIKGV